MKSKDEILKIIDMLDRHSADHFEGQDLDFKEWTGRSMKDMVDKVVKYAVCMANGGGGTVVFGVKDKAVGRKNAISGVPREAEVTKLQEAVYSRTDPKITPYFEWVEISCIPARLLFMNVFPGMAPYTETSGEATIRIGKECVPLTGSMRREVFSRSGNFDVTAEIIDDKWERLVSLAALEKVREIMKKEKASPDLIKKSDADFLASIGALKNAKFTLGGLLVFGGKDALKKYVPDYGWEYRRMKDSTDYIVKDGGNDPIPIAVSEIEKHIMTENHITTVKSGLYHYEYKTYPESAIREAILNAFLHRDFKITGRVMVKLYKNRIELTNPGNFIGGITPDNILHHPPVARNSLLADILDKIRLVNRSNLGVPRIYRSLLEEGKEPPQYREVGNFIELTINSSELKPQVKDFLKRSYERGMDFDIDHLIIIHYLLRHREMDYRTTARVCQRSIESAKEILGYMENDLRILESGDGKRKIYMLSKPVYNELLDSSDYHRDMKLDDESIKVRILAILKKGPLTNAQVRQITGKDRFQVIKLMKELENDGVKISKQGRSSYYYI